MPFCSCVICFRCVR